MTIQPPKTIVCLTVARCGSSDNAVCCLPRTGQVTSTGQPLKMHLHRTPGDSPEATAAAEKAASAEAAANADSSNAAAYSRDALLAVATEADDLTATVTVASAARVPQVLVIPIDHLLPLFRYLFCALKFLE